MLTRGLDCLRSFFGWVPSPTPAQEPALTPELPQTVTAPSVKMAAATPFTEIENPPSDIISSARFSPMGDRLAVGSWDRSIYLYSATGNSEAPFIFTKKIGTRSPVLDVCWADSHDNSVYVVGLDHDVRRISLDTEAQMVFSTHTAVSNKIAWSSSHELLISSSWDSTLHIHQLTGTTPSQIPGHIRVRLPAKPYAIALTHERLTVAMADRKICVYELNALRQLCSQASTALPGSGEDGALANPSSVPELNLEPWQRRDSNLKFMTRAVACMPNGLGFTTSSIEGRVSVEWYDPETPESKTYAFKCHRQVRPDPENEGEEVDMVYPINALAYHPVHGTFATGGGDGYVCLWDAETRRRVRMYKIGEASVSAMDFTGKGKMMVVGLSPGFEQGVEKDDGERGMVKLFVRELKEDEAKGKPAKK